MRLRRTRPPSVTDLNQLIMMSKRSPKITRNLTKHGSEMVVWMLDYIMIGVSSQGIAIAQLCVPKARNSVRSKFALM